MEKRVIYMFLILLFSPTAFGQGEKTEIKMLEIGSKAPFFDLPSVDGRNYSLNDFDDSEILVVVFTCNHCPTAQAYEDRIIRFTGDYKDKGVAVVAISPNSNEALSLAEIGYSDLDDSFESMKIRAETKNFNFPYLFDGDNHEVSKNYGPQVTPHVFVFDESRKLRYRGRIDDTENPYLEPTNTDLRNVVDELLDGKNPLTETTKTFGCSVKWPWNDEWTKKLINDWEEEPVTITEANDVEIMKVIANDGDKLRLVNVWATWCGPCVIEFPELVKIYRMYSGRDFEFVTMSADKITRKDKVISFLEEMNASNANYIFSTDETYKYIEAIDPDWQGSLPYSLLIKPGGEIIYSHAGAIDPLELKSVIIEYLGRYFADDK